MGRWLSLNPVVKHRHIHPQTGPSCVCVTLKERESTWLWEMCESSSNEDIDKETLKDALIDEDVISQVSPTFPFLSCRLISTRSRCHPGLVPLLSCPIRIFSITSPTSSNWEKTAQCLQSCSRALRGRSNPNLHTHLHDEHVLSSPLKVQTSLSLVDTQGFLLGAHSL